MLDPKCAILDEPDSGLDVDGIKLLTEKLNEYIESDPTKVLIIITHYEKLIEELNVSSVSIMKDANIIQHEGKDIAYQIFEEGFANV
jgi:Fe-S cluster assembly ATP-binding protein